jgi:hypothetical protein
MNLKQIMRLAASYPGGGEQNLLDYDDLVNKNYGGSANTYNVRPENMIAVKPGSTLVMDCDITVTEFDVRFYDASGTYQSDKTYAEYNELTGHCVFNVPDDSFYFLPKWYRAGQELSVADLVAANPVIKYV